jgi:hypothetical protein
MVPLSGGLTTAAQVVAERDTGGPNTDEESRRNSLDRGRNQISQSAQFAFSQPSAAVSVATSIS